MVPALEAGATGYLLKDAPRDELVRAIRAAARGEAVLAPSVATRLVSQLRAPAHDALSDRELEVLTLIAQGETNRGAAARLFISEATVKTHLLHIYAKLDVNDRAAAVAVGVRARTADDALRLSRDLVRGPGVRLALAGLVRLALAGLVRLAHRRPEPRPGADDRDHDAADCRGTARRPRRAPLPRARSRARAAPSPAEEPARP